MSINIDCKICGNKENNKYLASTEMMLKMGGDFTYLHCSKCGCLSLLNIPVDMSNYYPSNYYSFTHQQKGNEKLKKIKNFIRKSPMKGRLGSGSTFDFITSKIKHISYTWLKRDLITLDSEILDVGCGNGFLIRDMKNFGFTDLTGIDPYRSDNIENNDLNIYVLGIESLQQRDYDLIMYHHSFEHIEDQHRELESIRSKLSVQGTLLIRIPVSDSYAFRKYKQNWVQLDAPRHIFLHTTKSMFELARKHGFVIDEVRYDSNIFQFTGSECYIRVLPMGEYHKVLTKKQLKEFTKKAKELNVINDGDSACFYLKKVLS